jgi:hypothetical protein
MNDLKDLEKTLFLRARTFSEESIVRRAWCRFLFTDHFFVLEVIVAALLFTESFFLLSTSLLVVTAIILGFIFSYRRFLTAAAIVRPSWLFFGFTAAAAIISLFPCRCHHYF